MLQIGNLLFAFINNLFFFFDEFLQFLQSRNFVHMGTLLALSFLDFACNLGLLILEFQFVYQISDLNFHLALLSLMLLQLLLESLALAVQGML